MLDSFPIVRLLLALLLFALSPAGGDFFFLQMSDPQFGMYAADKDFVQETANFEFAIANANRLHPAFVVVTGDLVNKPGDAAQIAEYHRIAAKLDPSIPIHNVAGNHDVGNEPTPESLAVYRKAFGPDYYSFQHGNFAGIVLDSSLIQHPGKAPEEAAKQEAWLLLELDKLRHADLQVAIFQHISFFLEKPDEPDQYFNIPRETRDRYLKLFERYGVHYIFAGHWHRNSFGKTPNLEMITTGPVSLPLGVDPSGFRVVIVRENKMESTYYGLGSIPNQVKLETADSRR